MKMKLTQRGVDRLKLPTSGKLDVWDTTLPAFGIQLRATGRRAWIIAVRRPGKSTTSRIKIGDPATMTLAKAQDRARELMRNPAELETPEPEDPGSRTLDNTPDPRTLDSIDADSPMRLVIAAFIARDQKPKNRSWKAVEQILRTEIDPKSKSQRQPDLADWSTRPLRSIAKTDVLAVVYRVVDRGKPIMANLLLAHLKRLFNWTVERELLETSPAADVKRPSPMPERDRVLTGPELYKIWHGCHRLGWPFGPLVRLMMLTAQREGEVAAMKWSDLNLDAATWMLKRAQTKAKRAHIVPLSSRAVRLLKSLPRVEGCDYVFPANRTGNERPVSGFSKVKVRLDKLCGVENWVFHDIRRTTATALAELGAAPHVTEKILNHRAAHVAGPMGKIYQRYDFLKERREALELWSITLMRTIAQGVRATHRRPAYPRAA